MIGNMLNDLAEAIRRWTEKNCFCWLLLTSFWTDTLIYLAFTCTTKALISQCTCVSVRRLDKFTCTFDFPRLTMLLLLCYYVTVRKCTEVTKDGW